MDLPDRVGPASGIPAIELWAIDLALGSDLLISLGERLGLATVAQPPQGAAAVSLHRTRAASRVALRLLLARHVGYEAARLPFVLAPGGKPSVAHRPDHPGIEFSLAHCDAAAVIAFSRDGPVGIDVEAPRDVRISARRRAQLLAAAQSLAPADRLPEASDQAQFLQAWVRLEALAKATGEGLGALLGRLDDVASPLHATHVNGVRIRVRDVGFTGHSLWAAVAGTNACLDEPASPEPVWLPLDANRLERLGRGEPDGDLLRKHR